ncbi:MAG: DNA-processing protein DprA [Clostridia bacterium]|nr:DNA-processing protein DprA [Clostridia bacterium]
MQNKKYWIWLSKIDLNPEKIKKCLEKYTPEDIWNLKEETNKFFTKEEINKIKNINYRKDLELHEQYLLKHKIELITIKDKEYPEKLKQIDNPPICLYVLGNKQILGQKSIAIVGSRGCSDYGKTVSQAFSYLLAKNNIVVVSGLAKGIDGAAHIGTLQAKGKTIAVIGTGIDLVYPKENKDLMEQIVENGGTIISEYPLGTKPDKQNFPRRNRIIAGLSDGVLVIEAREKSGALITVDYALEQGKNIYAVPRKYYKQNVKTELMNC